MRYPKAHAATSGSVPFALRGPKPMRTVLATAVAGAIGLIPTVMVASPAMAVAASGDMTIVPSSTGSDSALEGSPVSFKIDRKDNTITTGTFSVSVVADAMGTHPADTTDDVGTPSVSTVTVGTTTLPVTVTVPTIQDTTYEFDETFLVQVKEGATVIATATATIKADSDLPPSYTLTAAPPTVAESGSSLISNVTATLSEVSGRPVSINLKTQDGTATAPGDYTSLGGAGVDVPIAAGVKTSAATPVTIINDTVKDTADTETFKVNGTGTGTVNATSSATVSITDDETTPKLNVVKQAGTEQEGNVITYRVTATPGSELPITFHWDAVAASPANSAHGVATAGTDFPYPSSDARTVTIAPGSTYADIPITLTADNLNEISPEDYAIAISAPTNATLGTTTKVNGEIADAAGDTAPTVSLSGTPVTEGNSGSAAKTFTATLSKASGRTVTVNWSTDEQANARTTTGLAVDGKDYKGAYGKLVFAPGTLTQTFTVDVMGDTIDEGSGETFNIELSDVDQSAAGLFTTGPYASVPVDTLVTITDDDDKPTFTFDDESWDEGNAISAGLLPVKLVGTTSDHPLQFTLGTANQTDDYLTSDPSFVGGDDYELAGTTITVAPEQSTGYGVMLVKGDKIFEEAESTHATVTPSGGNAGLVTGAAKTAKVTLKNDDKAPDLEINSIGGKEGDTVDVTGTVTGVAQRAVGMSVTFTGQAADGKKAASASDFVNPGAKVVWVDGGTDSGTKIPVTSVKLNTDKDAEAAETIVVSGSGVNNVGTVTDGVITIAANGGATEPTDPEEPGDGTKPTISAPSKIVGAIAVPITGKAAANTTVELWGAPMMAEKADLKWIANTKSDAKGMYSFSRWIGQGYRFVARAEEMNSEEAEVWVQQNPVFVASSPSKGWVSLAVQGNPRDSGQTVIVQRWANGAWVNTWRGQTGSNDLWKATVKQPSGSTWTLRAFVAGYTPDGILPGYTAAKKLTVK